MRILSHRSFIPLFVLTGLLLGGVFSLLDFGRISHLVLLTFLSIGVIPLFLEITRSMLRGAFGVDLIAIVAIVAALALGQYLAGTVILLMLSGGEALEAYAIKRARKDLTALLSSAPTQAHRKIDGQIETIDVALLKIGDIVMVKPGEAIPIDALVLEGSAMVDESALTGESLPVAKGPGREVMSGSICTDGLLTIQTLRESKDSRYQQIIALVQEAERNKAPFVRLADRTSVWFTAIALGIAGLAWAVSGDPVRMLAVLVVATPCPLLLATPTAFAAGISRSAKRGIIVRNAAAIEKLGQAKSFVFDKTGTLTLGTPSLIDTRCTEIGEGEALRLAASLDQFSIHILAQSLVQAASQSGLVLLAPSQFEERFGSGVSGIVDGRRCVLGNLAYLRSHGIPIEQGTLDEQVTAQEAGTITVYLAIDGRLAATFLLSDTVRPNVKHLFAHLAQLGIRTTVMLTGDARAVALRVAREIGLREDQVHAQCLPEEKVSVVARLRRECAPVVMVGDGVNDAPAIAAADVGIAMGGHGSTASSQASDIVILADRIERVGEALAIGHRVLAIAKQSIGVGIGLSAVLMIIALLGYLPPVAGALCQEVIDVIVILNALRVLLDAPMPVPARPA